MAFPWMGSFDPLTLTGPARFRAPPPPDVTSERYTRDYNEVKAKGAAVNSTRTPEQTDIAYFWTDNFAVQLNRGNPGARRYARSKDRRPRAALRARQHRRGGFAHHDLGHQEVLLRLAPGHRDP